MTSEETVGNDNLAAAFQAALIQELQALGVRFTKATAVNFSDVNIDVHIWIEDKAWPLFKYIGIGWLKRRKLEEMTLEAYVKGYVDRELKDLKEEIEYHINDSLRTLQNEHISDGYRRDTTSRLESARKIAAWLDAIQL